MKFQEQDIVELLEDLPDDGFIAGHRGIVVVAFEQPSEAYDVAMESKGGELLGFAYSVKPAKLAAVREGKP